MPSTPPIGLMRNFQIKVIAPPATIPASAPCILERFQNNASSTSGPNEAPKPAQANETICSTTIANFYVIFAGAFPPNPSELLGGEKFRALLEAAQKTFDMIIVDTPPVGSVIDAAVVSRVCDGVVLVLRDGAVSRRFAQRVKEQLDAAGAKILGCVLNDIKFSGNRYYSRYYGKHYGDYYGKQ